MSDFWVPVLASSWMLSLGLWLAAVARIAKMADLASKITGGVTVACLIIWAAP